MDTEDAVCGFCKRGVQAEEICGPLHLQELPNGEVVAAHHKCMQYSALLVQYKFKDFGGFKINHVREEIQRGKKLKCNLCKTSKTPLGKTGATAGCAVKRCSKTFHFYCAHQHPKVITKRLVVEYKEKQKTAVLYRVFCCQEHKEKYIADLKAYKDDVLPDTDSDSDDEEGEEDWNDWKSKMSRSRGKTKHRSRYKPETTSPKVPGTSRPSQQEHSEDSSKHADSDPEDTNTNAQTPAQQGKRQSFSEVRSGPSKRFKKSVEAKQTGNGSSSELHKTVVMDAKVVRRHLPVVRVTAIDSHLGRTSPASSCASEASSLTSSNGHSTPDHTTCLSSNLRKVSAGVNLSRKVTDVAAVTVALCVVGNLEISADRQDELLNLIENQYCIRKHSIYLWHKVVKKHGLKSPHMIHFISELTESLVNGELQRMEQLLICPQSQGVQEKFLNILALQAKLGDGFRSQLDQGIYDMIHKGLRKVKKSKGCTVGELLALHGDCVLLLLIHSKMEGMEELLNVFSPTKALERGDNSTQVLYPLMPDNMAGVNRKFVSPGPMHVQEDMRKLMWWCVANISEPVQLEVLPLERDILCSPDYLDSSLALQMYQFMKKMYAFKSSVKPEMLIMCVLILDQHVVQPSEYLLRVLKRFLVTADSPQYAFVDVRNVSVHSLLKGLNEIASNSDKNLEIFSPVNPEVRSVTTVILKASDKANCCVTKHHQSISVNLNTTPRSYPQRNASDEKPVASPVQPITGDTFVGVKFVDDGQVPSSRKQKNTRGRSKKSY